MNKTSKFILATALLVSANFSLATAHAADVTLRFHHFLSPKSTIPANFIAPWAEKVEADSEGRIDVQIFPAMQLGGKPPSLIDQVKDGVVDLIWTIPGYTPGRFPGVEALELPFVTALSAETSSKAAWDFYEANLQDEFSDFKMIAVHTHGPGVIHVRDKSVKSLEDMKGLKLRAPTRVANGVLAELGASPVGMPVPAFPEALSKGVVDGGVIPWEIVPALKVEELASSHTQLGGDRSLYNAVFVVAMNKASFDAMPEDLKAIIDANSGVETSALAGRAADAGDDVGAAAVEASGNEVITLDEAEVERWKAASEKVITDWIAEMDANGRDGQKLVDDVRELVKKYDSM